MGNKPKPRKDSDNTSPRSIADPEGGGGGVAVDVPSPRWTLVLEDLAAAANSLQIHTAVRGERAIPRIRVYIGYEFIGFVSSSESADIRRAMDAGRGANLLGQVVEIDLTRGRVVVELRLEGE